MLRGALSAVRVLSLGQQTTYLLAVLTVPHECVLHLECVRAAVIEP